MRLFLVCSPGTEKLALAEAVRLLPGATITLAEGGVAVEGDASLVARSNLWLRLPTRVLLRLGDVEARDFGKLERGLATLPFSSLLPRNAAIAIRASAQRSRLYHTGALAERVALAAQKVIGATLGDDDTAFSLLLRGVHDRFTLSLDTSGELLHRRGWRTEGGEAPLRETLAAALLAIANHRPGEPLCDPMCGSGTLVIEAASAALGRAPGIARSFAFERFAGFDQKAWTDLRDEARARERRDAPVFVAADADPEQLAVARRNAERASVQDRIEFREAELRTLTPTQDRGLLVANPPYGKRIGARGGQPLRAVYDELGRALGGAFARWRAAVVVEDRRLLPALKMPAQDAQGLSNGGLRVWVGQKPATR